LKGTDIMIDVEEKLTIWLPLTSAIEPLGMFKTMLDPTVKPVPFITSV
jgi:hypothetical protein